MLPVIEFGLLTYWDIEIKEGQKPMKRPESDPCMKEEEIFPYFEHETNIPKCN
jgi:hypothetical protein